MIIKPGFRYDINALRALAVISVLFYHFNVPFTQGGFSGVDVFYVISGYLMTKIILDGLAREQFSLSNFYNKRIQRIIPALTFMIIVVLGFCFFTYMPDDYQEVAKNGAGSLLFISNFVYALTGSYFGNSADNNIFLHTWSLSVEWQFYLLLPLALIVVNKYLKNDRRKYFNLCLIAIVVIFAGALLVTRYRPNMSFYLLPSRSWEMLAGGLAFLTQTNLSARRRKLLSSVGFLVLVVGMVFLHKSMKWPGFYTLIPVAATYVIIVANINDFKFLKSGIVQFFGKISYSLYLWHWPVFVIGNYLGAPATPLYAVLGILLSIVLGYLSYRYIESFEISKNRYIVATTGGFAALAFIASLSYVNPVIFKNNTVLIADYEAINRAAHAKQFEVDSCFIRSVSTGLETYNKNKCLPFQKGQKNVLLLGDSHAAQFFQALRKHFVPKGVNLGHASASSCLPLKTPEGPGPGKCADLLNFIYDEMLPQHAGEIESVILSANWVDNPNGKEQLLKDIQGTIAYLEQMGIKSVVLGQTETYRIDYSTIAARENEYGIKNSENYLDEETAEINAYLKAGLKDKYIDLFRQDYFAKVSPQHVPYMFDQNHLTTYGVEQLLKGTVYKNKTFQKTIDN
jgi:peptidoglycan/LPS O-acetylase OafA/YrhL